MTEGAVNPDAMAAVEVFLQAVSGKKQDMSYFPLNDLRQAPENGLLYEKFCPHTDADDAKLYWSIQANGIREPLHVSADGVILSGHRRYAAAAWLKLAVVPCIVAHDVVYGDLSADERLEVLATYNKQREKSNTERLREAMQEITPDEAYQNLLQNKLRTAIESCLDMELFRREQDQEKNDAAFIAARKKMVVETMKEAR